MTFGSLFDRAAAYDVDEAAIRQALTSYRESDASQGVDEGNGTPAADPPSTPPTPSPARVVADADVLAADLFLDGPAREALDQLRSHSWTTVVASDVLIADATAMVETLGDAALAGDWRERMERWREPVTHPPGDHPALASAYRGGAMQVISDDPALTRPGTAAGLQGAMPVSVRDPRAFATVFSPERLYPEVGEGEYPGPDRDPRE
nr:hypothetical protein [Halorubrum vacuolatum]